MVYKNSGERPKITILTHFEELRRRLFIYIGFLFLLWIVFFSQFFRLVPFLVRPYQLAFPNRNLDLVFTTLPEAIMAALKSTFFLSLALSLPMLVFQAWRFLSPALFDHEKRFLRKILLVTAFFSIVGLVVAYFFVLPILLKLLLGIGYTRFIPYLRVQSYLSFLGKSLFFAVLIAQLPSILALLIKSGVLPPNIKRKRFFYLVGGAYILALFLSPSDFISQLILAFMFYLLLELGFLLSKIL